MSLLITFMLGLFFIVGWIVVKVGKNTKTIENMSVSIALGTMFALVFLDLFPEMLEHMEDVSSIWMVILIILGVGILKVLDIFIPEHDHEHSLHHDCSEENLVHIGIISLVAIVLHNIIEGMAVYSLASESIRTGMLIALGVGLHNIPMGMILSSTLEHEKKSQKIIAFSLAVLSTFMGGFIMFLLSNYITDTIIGMLISITLGMILYIILFELIPHVLHGEHKKRSLIGFFIVIFLIIISSIFE